MLCEEVTNVKIVMHGNTFDRFYRFPNPEFVRGNELGVGHYRASHAEAECSEGAEDDEKKPDRISRCSTQPPMTCATNSECTNAWESCGSLDAGVT